MRHFNIGSPCPTGQAAAPLHRHPQQRRCQQRKHHLSRSQCGTKPGVKATGSPIALGTIVTSQPGTSFTDIASMANAYFTCVNDNGGVNGHPVKY